MTVTRGVDVSHYQGNIDWPAVKAGGVDFAIIKATEGANGVDPRYAVNRRGAEAAGLAVATYHFAQPGNPVQQAKHHMSVIGTAPLLGVAGDFEVPLGNDQAFSEAWLGAVHGLAGVLPWDYGSQGYFGRFVTDSIVMYPLWAARYGAQPRPHPWPSYDIWQNSSTGHVVGIAGNVDTDVSTLSINQLANLVRPVINGKFVQSMLNLVWTFHKNPPMTIDGNLASDQTKTILTWFQKTWNGSPLAHTIVGQLPVTGQDDLRTNQAIGVSVHLILGK